MTPQRTATPRMTEMATTSVEARTQWLLVGM